MRASWSSGGRRLALIAAAVSVATVVGAAEQTLRLARAALEAEVVTDTTRLAAEFGPRFDQTAYVRSVTVHGRTFLAPNGLADEFGLEGVGVLGFAEANLGDPFVKIGVGVLRRDRDGKYQFQHPYPVVRRFPVTTTADSERVEVVQDSDEVRGFRYHYVKRYRLAAGDVLQIEYELTNTGARPFEIEQYNHDFLAFDGAPGGSGYTVTPRFALPQPPVDPWRRDDAGAISLRAPELSPRGAYWRCELDVPAARHALGVWHPNGQHVEISGDARVVRFALWANPQAFCPELFVRWPLAPGATARWSRTYSFGP